MNGYLTNNQIEYIFYHLNLSLELNDKIKKYFLFNKSDNTLENQTSKIVFNLSSDEFDIKKILWNEEIPILFPLSKSNNFYSIENNNLIFHHDILKSCFYLLSGYQEYNSTNIDSFGRFTYKNSVQEKLGIIGKPIVNYYFKIIATALNEFLKQQNIELKQRTLFNNFAFFLTHDIDNVDYYTFNRLLYKTKEITGLVKTYYSFKTNIKHIFKTSFELLKFSKKQNPAWNFNYLRDIEKQNNFRSAFYFLQKDKKYHDSDYNYSDNRINSLFQYLINEGCEIGLHGTVASVTNEEKLFRILENINSNLPNPVLGIRQHRLLYKLPETTLNHEKVGLKYDTSLCFAEHEGFRNSFCLPFKLYDFENDHMIDVWEIPLNAMDVTLFHYRELNNSNAQLVIKSLIQEIKKFNGVFTLLWHNDFFDEDRFVGIKSFYEDLLRYINSENPENCLAYEIIRKCSAN